MVHRAARILLPAALLLATTSLPALAQGYFGYDGPRYSRGPGWDRPPPRGDWGRWGRGRGWRDDGYGYGRRGGWRDGGRDWDRDGGGRPRGRERFGEDGGRRGPQGGLQGDDGPARRGSFRGDDGPMPRAPVPGGRGVFRGDDG